WYALRPPKFATLVAPSAKYSRSAFEQCSMVSWCGRAFAWARCSASFARFLRERNDLCGRRRIPLDVSHLVGGVDERFQPPVELKIVFARSQFLGFNRHPCVIGKGYKSRSYAIDVMPKLIGYFGWNGKLIKLRHRCGPRVGSSVRQSRASKLKSSAPAGSAPDLTGCWRASSGCPRAQPPGFA